MTVQPEDKFKAVKLRFKDQSELLHRLTLIDLRLFIGYLTIQLLAGSWFIANMDKMNSLASKFGLLLIDFSLAIVALTLLHRQKLRRKEAVNTIRNCCKALGYQDKGAYIKRECIDPEMKTRFWFPLYAVGIISSFLGFILVVFANSVTVTLTIIIK